MMYFFGHSGKPESSCQPYHHGFLVAAKTGIPVQSSVNRWRSNSRGCGNSIGKA